MRVDFGQGLSHWPTASFLPNVHPMLDHMGLIGLELEALGEGVFSQLVTFLIFLNPADVVERHHHHVRVMVVLQ